jgi:hypothetical protein
VDRQRSFSQAKKNVVGKDQERILRKRKLEKEDLEKILGTDEGLRFLWRVLEISGIYRTTFTGNSHSFFNEGRRSVGLEIKADLLEIDPGHEGIMAREYRNWLLKNDLILKGGKEND